MERDPAPDGEPGAGALPEMAAGFLAVGTDASLREVVVLIACVLLVDGALDVLVVVAALDFLDGGETGAGVLNAAWAAGAMAGGGAVMVLLSRGHLTQGITIGAVLLGGGTVIAGAVSAVVPAAAAMVVFGVGFTLVEVASLTLAQRLTPGHLLGRVGGVLETTAVVAAAVGSLAAGLLVEAVGPRAPFFAVGLLLPAVVLLRRRRLAVLEAGAPVEERAYRLLRGHEIFGPLSVAQAERLAGALQEVRPAPGAHVMTQGEHGDRFFLIAEGQVDVLQDGERRRTCGPGDGVGEIALLRDVQRTATVRARQGVVLLALDRAAFLEAVASQGPALRAAHRVADEREAPA